MEAIVNTIKAKVKRLQNGDVSTAMKRMGLNYELNYGVSIPLLRNLASEYQANNELAFQLLSTPIRETQILASMLFEVSNINFDQLLSISTSLTNIELVEQFSKNLYSKSNDLSLVLPILIDGDVYHRLLALYSSGWAIRGNHNNSEEIITWGIDQLEGQLCSADTLMQKAVVFVMQGIVNISDTRKSEMVNLAESLLKSDNDIVVKVAQEFLWLNL